MKRDLIQDEIEKLGKLISGLLSLFLKSNPKEISFENIEANHNELLKNYNLDFEQIVSLN